MRKPTLRCCRRNVEFVVEMEPNHTTTPHVQAMSSFYSIIHKYATTTFHREYRVALHTRYLIALTAH